MESINNKIILLSTSLIAITTISSCVKTKDYNCECTYVARSGGSAAGQPDKVEITKVKGRFHEQAVVECDGLSSKYFADYSGTCLIK